MICWRTGLAGKVDGNGEVGEGRDVQIDWITHRHGARRYRETRISAERQSPIRALQNCAAAFVDRNVCGADFNRLRIEHV
jgi:hypothetical protein